MGIGDYISEAFKYAFSDIKKGIVGGLLLSISEVIGFFLGVVLLAFLIPTNPFNKFNAFLGLITLAGIGLIIALIIGFIVDGYYVRVMKITVDGSDKLPEWSNIIDLIGKGLLYFVGEVVLGIIFFIIPIIILVINILMMKGIHAGIIISFGLFFILLFISAILLLIYLPLAEVNFSVKGFSGFFEFKNIFRLMSIDYIVLLILVWIISFIISLIVSIPFELFGFFAIPHTYYPHYPGFALSPVSLIINLISSIVNGFVGFFLAVFSKRAIALYYKDKTSNG